MTLPANLTLFINFHVRGGNNFCREWQDLRIRKNQAVKLHLHPSFAEKMAGILVILEMAAEHSPSREDRMSERAE